MSKRTKAIAAIITTIVVVIGGVFVGMKVKNKIDIQRKLEEQKALELVREMEIKIAYLKINYALNYALSNNISEAMERDCKYVKFENGSNPNRVLIRVYLSLKYYEKKTGKVLGYDFLLDYFKQEYEVDGTLRLYNNGHHPEIEAYVEWMQDNRPMAEEYVEKVYYIYREYTSEYRYKGFECVYFYNLTRQMLEELIKKEADPDYELDLIALQQKGY